MTEHITLQATREVLRLGFQGVLAVSVGEIEFLRLQGVADGGGDVGVVEEGLGAGVVLAGEGCTGY